MTAFEHSGDHTEAITMGLHDASPPDLVDAMAKDVELELGWGRLIFGQTFADARFAVVGQRERIDIDFDRDARLDLVHVLPARTAGPRGGGAEQVGRNDDAVAEVEVAHA